MKNIEFKLSLTLIFMITLSVARSLPGNVPESFHTNPFLLNGKPMDITACFKASQGKVSMVKRNFVGQGGIRVPFFVHVVRGGKAMEMDYSSRQPVEEIELAVVLKSAKVGDQLIFEPAASNEKMGQRTIMVKEPPFIYQPDWFRGVIKGKGGC
jgi:hypothetical protein